MQIKQLIANQLLNLQFDLRIAKYQQTIANKLFDLQFDLRIAKFQQLIAVKWTTSLLINKYHYFEASQGILQTTNYNSAQKQKNLIDTAFAKIREYLQANIILLFNNYFNNNNLASAELCATSKYEVVGCRMLKYICSQMY